MKIHCVQYVDATALINETLPNITRNFWNNLSAGLSVSFGDAHATLMDLYDFHNEVCDKLGLLSETDAWMLRQKIDTIHHMGVTFVNLED